MWYNGWIKQSRHRVRKRMKDKNKEIKIKRTRKERKKDRRKIALRAERQSQNVPFKNNKNVKVPIVDWQHPFCRNFGMPADNWI